MLSAGCPVRSNWHVFAQTLARSFLPLVSENQQIQLSIKEDTSQSQMWPSLLPPPPPPPPPLATIITIAKPGKDSNGPNDYCLTSLTCCVCKTFERIINHHLVLFSCTLYTYHVNPNCSKKARSTVNHLMRFGTYTRERFLNGEHLGSIFLTSKKHMTPLGNIKL